MLEVVVICSLFLLVGWLGLLVALKLAPYLTSRPVSVERIFVGLKPKLWMTAGLGLFFAGFYVAIILLAARLLDAERRQNLFQLALRHPTYFIYAGLTLFASISLTTLAVRKIIKRLYNAKF